MKKLTLNKALENALNALDPLVNAYATVKATYVGNSVGDETMIHGAIEFKKLRAAKEAADGLYKFYKCKK
jgi:hypothetical protein